jgi:hypothetical protein
LECYNRLQPYSLSPINDLTVKRYQTGIEK